MPSKTVKNSKLDKVAKNFNIEEFKVLHEEMTFSEYLEKIYENPLLIRTAYQRLYDMIMEKGFTQFERYRKKLNHYNFFDNEKITIFVL